MELRTIQQQLEELIQHTSKILKNYHEAKTNYENLEEMKKPILATIEIRYLDLKTQNEIARSALADTEYKEYLAGLATARKAYNEAWARLKSLEIKKDCLQSLNKYVQ